MSEKFLDLLDEMCKIINSYMPVDEEYEKLKKRQILF